MKQARLYLLIDSGWCLASFFNTEDEGDIKLKTKLRGL
jgi:hypothetical protein